MPSKKFVVPDGMLKVAYDSWMNNDLDEDEGRRALLEAVIRWLAENPIVPTDEQIKKIADDTPRQSILTWQGWLKMGAVEWQRRMFLAPEPEIPECLRLLLWKVPDSEEDKNFEIVQTHNESVLCSYNLGRKSEKE